MARHNKGRAGERRGHLVAVREIKRAANKSGTRNWLFACDCGGEIARPLSMVRTGRYTSCGCRPPTRKQRACLFRERFKVSSFEADLLAVRVEGTCDVCGEPETKVHGRTKLIQFLAVDHCHGSGTVRGVLCASCNTGEGLIRGLQNARNLVAYLERAEKLANKNCK